ncbi:YbjQ family protein [Thiolapillus sp.]
MNIQVTCPKCGVYNGIDDEDCWKCGRAIEEEEKQAAIDYAKKRKILDEKIENPDPEEIKGFLDQARKTGNWDNVPEKILTKEAERIILTNSFFVANHDIKEEIEIITAEIVYGVNVFRDIFAGIRDIVGGRSSALQKVLKDARKTVLSELRKEALTIGADAVISIKLTYQEISGGGKSGLIMLVASGTAVNLNKA